LDPFTVRRLGPVDAPAYRALMLAVYQADADAFTTTVPERESLPVAFWERRIAAADGSSVGFGAFAGETLVGAVVVEYGTKPKTRHKSHLIGMAVDAARRGRGAGRALVDAALADAEAHPEVSTMTLTVTDGNAAAIGLYLRCGFAAFGTEPRAIRSEDGRLLAKVHMWRPIGG
jgi:ribosomal protein S18 acetylase RimI-like enzyme